MKKSKKIILCSLAVCLVVAMSIGGTMAYLSMTTNTKENTFTFVGIGAGTGLNAELTEPAWDALTDTDGDGTPDLAEDVVPGREIPKNPTVNNNGTISEFVGLKVELCHSDGITAYTDVEAETILDAVEIDWNTGTETNVWTRYQGTATSATQNFYYNSAVASSASTTNLFSKVTYTTNPSTDAMALLNATGLQIRIVGSAVQSEGIDTASDASAEFVYA